MDFEHLIYNVDNLVATLTLNRPETLNALTPSMRQSFEAALELAETDDSVRVIVITGAGKGFCSGGDVKAMNEARKSGKASVLDDKIDPIRDRIVLALRDSTKPIIAAVNGAAAGAGMNIALACDIRIASDTAKFGETFAKRGLHPDWGGTYFLPRIVGMAKACELIWSGKMIQAREALELGIVSQLETPEALMTATLEMANSFAAGPPIAIRMAKRAMYRSMDSTLREALEFETYAQNTCSATSDAKEGIAAFVEKREAVFTGH
ncbi:MAG: enoyl-CoA hydratase/isomerase family protein [Gammaproteobacteria bacterium]|jgi:2-(1,2-epoxy-1,2-dihydrophenyl)acetyl-CoA isomerase|nr:enoyl-CoA hydratase/isomerase family protein [Gammaproteobacteria bacterium]MBT5725075.1 enoyl-CoA hydratase/isomerase family protein [Gammaproteobacteria bacterium]MDG1232769.1 enoyl-CoA hydratase-related protein [Pseudomonadales bacterium]